MPIFFYLYIQQEQKTHLLVIRPIVGIFKRISPEING